jgi:hopanoid biosynthesis associated RND transporter like protein HpnN
MDLVRILVAIVDVCRRHALIVVIPSVLISIGLGYYTSQHLGIDTDTSKLISPDLPWRKREAAFDKAFPQNANLLAVAVEARTPDQAEDATEALTAALQPHTDIFKVVRRPDGGPFFKQNGLMLLPLSDVQAATEQMINAQPLIGALATDPSLRGLFTVLSTALIGVERGDANLDSLESALGQVADTTQSVIAGNPQPLSWQTILTGRKPLSQELRRFIMVQPELDYDALQPGARASAAVRQIAADLHLAEKYGVRVRLTGPVALSDEEFGSVAKGAGWSTSLSFAAVCLILFFALRSARLIAAILITLVVGLITTAAFATAAVGHLNLISVAFAVLFVGIAVDFGIQFSVRYRAERFAVDDLGEALKRATARVGVPLTLAAAATAVGFLSFLPTDYLGVSQLGLIAGVGMIIALALNLTLLPALLALLRPAGEAVPVGYAWAAPIDRFLLRRRKLVLTLAALIAVLGLALSPKLKFDFNPLHLKDPHTESMETLADLMNDPETTPYSLDVMTASVADAADLSKKIGKLPEVFAAVSISNYVPEQQDEKLAALGDAAQLLLPTLSPAHVADPPTDNQILAAMAKCAGQLRAVAIGRPKEDGANRLAAALDQIFQSGPAKLPALDAALITGLKPRLDDLRMALSAKRVTYADLPPDLIRSWVAPDGRARIDVFPKIDVTTNAGIERFAAAVRTVAPQVSGGPIAIQESAQTVVDAFALAGTLAVIAIGILLFVTLRRVRDVALVLAPLLLAALMTLITSIAVGLPLNFANIIALPLLLGIGVAFDIYFVMNWRAGLEGPLQSSTARAVLFSAATTTVAFGSLAASSHPGTSDMGTLLAMALFFTLVCTLFVLPALLGPVKTKAA